MGFCCRCAAILAALLAVLLGALYSGALKAAQFWKHFDLTPNKHGEHENMGLVPGMHHGTPWGFTLAEMPDLSGELFLVTGANVGLGYWTAYHLAARKGRVLMGCRSLAKCEAAAGQVRAGNGGDVEAFLLDLASFRSIRTAAKKIVAAHPSLDGLVLNAGIMVPPFALTEEGFESQIGTNHFGHFLLTQLLLPQLERAASRKGVATVVSVSSNAHYNSYPEGILPTLERMNDRAAYDRMLAYGQSKLANVLFAQELSERVRGKGILVNGLHPGFVQTELFRHVFTSVKGVSPKVGQWLEDTMLDTLAWDARDAALTQLYCAVGPGVRDRRVTGRYYHPIARENKPSFHAFNVSLQKHLWSLSESVIASH